MITLGHIDSSGELGASLSGGTVVLVVHDVATGWLGGYPAGSNCAEEVVSTLQHFVAPAEEVGFVTNDDAQEYVSACKKLDAGIKHQRREVLRPTA